MKKDDILHIRIEGRLKKKLRIAAKKQKLSMAELAAIAIEDKVAVR